MTQDQLKGLVILFSESKGLVQTKRIRIHQRESLVDKLEFLIPFEYEGLDLTTFNVMMEYIAPDLNVYSEILNRNPEDYEDKDGNKTHMIYGLDVSSKLTKQSGDVRVLLSLTHMDYEAATDDPDAELVPKAQVLKSDETILTILPLRDYYSAVNDDSLSAIDRRMLELDQKIQELNESAEQIIDLPHADDLVLDLDDKSIYLTAEGNKIGSEIGLNDLGNALADNTEDGLVNVITSDDVNP